MNRFRKALTVPALCALLGALMPATAFGQARPVEVPELNTQFTSSGVANLRVGSISEDGTEALLVMEYTYNGNAGPTALIVPVIENRRQRGVSGWFGSDRVAVPRGKGLISIKVKFFNDEPGAPATITTDSIRMLILNSTGTVIIGGSTELKTINWGKAGTQPTRSANVAEPADRKLAQLASEAEIRHREKARQAAEAEERARRETDEREAARARAAAEAKAAAEARAKADADARVRAEEKRKAEEKAATEARAREEASRKAEADARRLSEERQAAETRARAQAEAKEKARLEAEARKREQEQKLAEAEAARLIEEKKKAEAQAAAEARAREEAEVKAQLEARRLDEERRAAEEREREEEEARRRAAERAAAEARAREQAEAQAAEAARIKAEQEAAEAARVRAEQQAQSVADGRSRTKITNVDVVNRSLDRSQMTIGIEFDRKDKFNYMGVNVEHSANPAVKSYFSCEPKEVGRQKYALVQVAYAKPTASSSTVVTDRLQIYGVDSPGAADAIPLHTATMLLVWRAPGSATSPVAENPPVADLSSVEITDFRQRTPTSGYASVTYQLNEGTGQLRVRLKNSAQPGSSGWFLTEPVAVKAGQGLELIPVTVSADSTPSGALDVDTIEVELLDAGGKVISQTTKATRITWSREP